MTAIDLAARGLARRALAALSPCLFSELSVSDVAPEVDRIATTGHAAAGLGAGHYVHDALCDAALLAAHPACVFQSANGRIFRLLGANGAISVEQCGAQGDPAGTNLVNDQPAIQAALDYAAATGIGEVVFEQRAYSVWATQRVNPADQLYARDGHPLTVTATVALRSACGDSYLNFRGRDGTSMEDDWYLVKTTAGDAAPNAVWRGGGLFVLGDVGTLPSPLSIEKLTIDHVHLIGGRARTGNHGWPADPATGDGWDVTDKAFWLQDSQIGRIELIGVEIAGFKGELFYIGGAQPAHEYLLVDCHIHTTNGDALNAGGGGGFLTARGCRFGNAFQAAEVIGGIGQIYDHCRFYDSDGGGIGGGPTGGFLYNYGHAHRDPALPVPFAQLNDCVIDRIPNFHLGSWTRGTLTTIDCQLNLPGWGQNIATDIDLEITAWADRQAAYSVVSLSGPASLTEQVSGAPAEIYNQPARSIRIHVRSAKRTQQGRDANSGFFNSIYFLGGHFEAATVCLSADDVEASRYVDAYGHFVELPFVELARRFLPNPYSQPDGGNYSTPDPGSTDTVNPTTPAHLFAPTGAGVVEVAIGNNHAYVHGQRLRLWHGGGGAGDRIIRLSPGNAGLDLSAAVELRNLGDHVELQWNGQTGAWQRASGMLPAAAATVGPVDLTDIPDLPAGKVTSGQFDPARIPPLDAAAIGSGVIDAARLPMPDWSSIANRPNFASVAISGNYADLAGAPPLGLLAGAPLADPDADRIPFWDDSAGSVAWLGLGSGLSISGTTLSASTGGGGSSAWTLIASASPVGVPIVDFTTIAQTYADLMIVFTGVSHDHGSNAYFDARTSNDGGATFSGTGTFASQSLAASTLFFGALLIPGYTLGAGIMFGAADNHAASPGASTASARMLPWRADGGLNGLRIAMSAGNFDAGTITLYGR
ncbi:MAG: hypothetical protein KDE61_08580 [Novosphingobium sp.]|nr:hypothetical protein [Novosphingobium sp.]